MKYFTVCLLLFVLVIPAVSADNPTMYVNMGIKKVITDTDYVMPNALQRDRPRVVLFTTYVTDETGEVMQYASTALSAELNFFIEYCALFNTKVRFTFIWTGPTYRTHVTEWYQANVNNYYWLSVTEENPTSFLKGTYSLVVIAEQNLVGGGDDCVSRSVFKLY